MSDLILVLNAGSSSLKFALYEEVSDGAAMVSGSVSRLAQKPVWALDGPDGQSERTELGFASLTLHGALGLVFEAIGRLGLTQRVGAVGHRIVHGGLRFTTPCVLTSEVIGALHELTPLAPLHQPFNLAMVAAACKAAPRAVQIGCFDTAFHAYQPRLARLYGLPRELSDGGVLAYGFHGLSYAYIAERLRLMGNATGRVIVAHLGSGASLCAMRDGKSVATTMGFTALDGPPMSTRCGSLDPGVVLHLLQARNFTPDEVSDLLYERSGLLGVSGISGDMEALLASNDPRAKEAVALFVYRVAREIGSLAAALGGLDTLVFTAGIGENAPLVREAITNATAWLGAEIDPDRNARGETDIGAESSRVKVLVIPTDEAAMIAKLVRGVLAHS